MATRFNLAYTYSPEERQAGTVGDVSSNTTLRLADSLNVFDTGALANGVTVERARYQLVSAAAGMKYRGFWLQGEGYGRKTGPFRCGRIATSARSSGLRLLRSTGSDDRAEPSSNFMGPPLMSSANIGHPKEFIIGGNYYPWNTRNLRLNIQVINVDHSPVSSTFGFYTGQISGPGCLHRLHDLVLTNSLTEAHSAREMHG